MTVFIRGNVRLRIPASENVSQITADPDMRMLTESVVDADSPSHALLTLDGGEYLGGILESHWSFA